MGEARKLRVGILALLLCVAVATGFVRYRTDQPQTTRFCTASLPMREIDGRMVAVQDKDPNGTKCDLDQMGYGMATLGIDCKVRLPDGTVLDTLRSSREDGTCGFDSPAP